MSERATPFSSLESRMKYIMAEVNNIAFIPHFLNTCVYTKCAFSKVQFGLEVHTNKKKSAQKAFYVKDLFRVELSEVHRRALEFINKSRSVLWDGNQSMLEKHLALYLCSHVFKHICREDEIVLEKATYSKLLTVEPLPGVTAGYIGIGSNDTWHGSPDIRVRGTNIVLGSAEYGGEDDEDYEDDDEESCSSDGMTCLLEMKSQLRCSHLPQAIATCVTSSFTEKNIHHYKDLDANMLTILMDGTKFRVIVYNCVNDVLLISQPKNLTSIGCNGRRLSSTGVALLWLVINHRLFLQLPEKCKKYPAKITKAFEMDDSLKDFKSLMNKNLDWQSCRKDYAVSYSDLPVESDESPPRKRKVN